MTLVFSFYIGTLYPLKIKEWKDVHVARVLAEPIFNGCVFAVWRDVAPLIGANAPGDIFLVPHYTQHTIKALADIQFRNVHDERAKLFPKVRAVQQTNTTTNKMSVMYETIFMDHTQKHAIPTIYLSIHS